MPRKSFYDRSISRGVFAAVLLTSLSFQSLVAEDDRKDDDKSRTVTRVVAGLQVLYDLQSDTGDKILDQSGVEPALDLTIANGKQVRRKTGSLELHGKTIVRSNETAAKIIKSVQWTGEITIETWLKPASAKQSGPARIISFSKNISERNFTLGQDGNKFDVRFRTSATSTNGLPSLSIRSKSLATELTHVVYTRSRDGQAKIFLNGNEAANTKVAGDLLNWDGNYRFAIGNELSNDRPWQGTFYLVAIYNRALKSHEVQQNFLAGRDAVARPDRSDQKLNPNERAFFSRIAPLMVEHCLECHDTAVRKGELDLSFRDAALAGGESGKAIVPRNSSKSLLWKAVESDEMPHKRPALSDDEKQALKTWIDEGADWPEQRIDPAVYAHSQSSQQIWIRRLTVNEYIATVRASVGVDIRDEAVEMLPADLRADGFSNTAYNLNVDLKHIDAYAKLAEKITSQIDFAKLLREHSRHKNIHENNRSHLREMVLDIGRWILRGPLQPQELDPLMSVADDVLSRGGKAGDALYFAVEVMLQSPRFIYRVEDQRGDGRSRSVSPYELASRLSYMVWGGPPDKQLMQSAESGELFDSQKLASHVQRMLKDPRAVERSKEFVHQWLDLGRLANLKPSAKRFPQWNDQLAADIRQETLAYFEEVAWRQGRPLTDLLNAQFTIATPRLAKHYGFKVSDGKKSDQLSHFDLSKVPGRGGLLTHASVLTIGGDEASMVSRGLFVLHDLLRGAVKDPPPCVDTTPVPPKLGLTQRGIASERIANVNCGGCHSRFEPLAFGLEKFDGIGARHDQDEFGNALRDDGEILFPGTAKPISYANSEEMMNILASSDRVRQCITWKFTQFAIGRPISAVEAPILMEIDSTSHNNGGTYASLITAIVMSDLVRKTRTERY